MVGLLFAWVICIRMILHKDKVIVCPMEGDRCLNAIRYPAVTSRETLCTMFASHVAVNKT